MHQYAMKAVETEVSAEDRTVRGYAAVWDVLDADNERVVRGAFKRASSTQPFTWGHAQGVPLGHCEVHEDDRGLAFTATIYESDEGDRLLAAIKAGAVRGASLYAQILSARTASDGVRELTDLDLIEVSACFRGANPEAFVAKSLYASASQLMALARIRDEAAYVAMTADLSSDTTTETQNAVRAEAEETARQVLDMIKSLGQAQAQPGDDQ